MLSSRLESEPAESQVIDSALTYLAAAAKDGHTYYLPKSSWEAQQSGQSQGGFVTERTLEGYLVKELIPGTNAAKSLELGDLIVRINDLPVEEALRDPAVRNKESTLRLEISRKNLPTFVVELASEKSRWVSSRLLEGDIGYVRVRTFISAISCDSFKGMRKAVDDELQSLVDTGAKAWVLDLRDNGGVTLRPARTYRAPSDCSTDRGQPSEIDKGANTLFLRLAVQLSATSPLRS